MQGLILFIFCLCTLGFNSFSFAQETPVTPITTISDTPNLKVATVQQQLIPKYHSAPGYTAALNNIEISSKQSGFITKLLVEAGDIVDKGQLLLIIDETVNKQSIEQVKKEVEIANITVADAKKDVANFERLRKGQSISEEKLRKARLLLAHSQSILLKAKAKLIETQATRPYLRLVSPKKARVVKRLVDLGDLAITGKPLIHLEVLKPLLFETAIPVQWINKLSKGQSVLIKLNLNYQSKESQAKEVKGSIIQIITPADPSTQQCTIKLQLPNSLNIPTGLFGQAQFILKKELVLTIPEQAIISRVGITGVFRVDTKKNESDMNKIIFTPIRLGKKYQNQQVVLSGLNRDEQIIVSPSDKLNDEMIIRNAK